MDQNTLSDYKRKGFAVRSGFGRKPVLLLVDFINGFTDPSTPLGGELGKELAAAADLLAVFRRHGLPVVFTTISYEPDMRDAGMWIKKIPSLSILVKGSHMAEVDSRVAPQPGEYVVRKNFASAFFGTQLDTYLKAQGIDTVVVREGVGDRAQGPHEANLFDIDAKYGDVIPLGEAMQYVESLTAGGGYGDRAADDFQQWWSQGGNGGRGAY